MPEISNEKENKSRKGRLGRGLGSLLSEKKTVEETSKLEPPAQEKTKGSNQQTNVSNAAKQEPVIPEDKRIWTIPIEKLKANPNQPRKVFSSEALDDLTRSIKEKGILQPLIARRIGKTGEFEIIAGERRWRAAQAAGLQEVPTILRSEIADQDSFEFAIIENVQRHDLNPVEEAEAYQRLISEYGLTQGQVAEKLGKERSSVANLLRILALPMEVREKVSQGLLSTGHAKVLLGVSDIKEQVRLARQIVEQKLSVRAVESLILKAKAKTRDLDKSAETEKTVSTFVDRLGQELQKLLGSKVTIDYKKGQGKVAIQFYSDSELNQIIDRVRKVWGVKG